MVLIIVDLEATCWDSGQTLERQEIIEIGAVRVRAPRFEPETTNYPTSMRSLWILLRYARSAERIYKRIHFEG